MRSPINILVVDDEPIVAMGLQVSLQQLGYCVTGLASTGEAALEKISGQHPDLVLMDIRIKGAMDGIETAEKIRAQFDIPVVFLSAFADDETLQRAKIAEPFGYIVKPFERRNLQTTIETACYKHQMERRVRESEHRFIATLTCIGEAVIATDTNSNITFLNPTAEKLSGWTQEAALGKSAGEVFRLFDEQTRLPLRDISEVAITGTAKRATGLYLLSRDDVEIPVEHTAALIRGDKDTVIGWVLVLMDISERKRAEAERQNLIAELQSALASVKKLSGLLPICCHCKKIRDDRGDWIQIESYISSRSQAGFTHGICPDCRQANYPEC